MGVYRVNTRLNQNPTVACWELANVVEHLIAWGIPLVNVTLTVPTSGGNAGHFMLTTTGGIEADATRQAHLNVTRTS